MIMNCQNCGNVLSEGAKFCTTCGKPATASHDSQPIQATPISPVEAERLYKKYGRLRWIAALGPITVVFLIVSIWGALNFLNELSQSSGSLKVITDIFGLIIPIIIALAVLAIPIGIILAFRYNNKRNQITLVNYDQRSGQGYNSVVPDEIRKWNWGAFGLTFFWGLRFGVVSALLCLIPFVGLVWAFVLGAKGSEWAWRNNKWRSVEDFKKSRRRWNIAGIIALLIIIPLGIIGAFLEGSSSTDTSPQSLSEPTSNIASSPKDSAWITYNAINDRFSITLPTFPTLDTSGEDLPVEGSELTYRWNSYTSQGENANFAVYKYAYSDVLNIIDEDAFLEALMNGAINSDASSKLTSSKYGYQGQFRTLDFEVENPTANLRGRLLLVGQTPYLLVMESVGGENLFNEIADYNKFIASFEPK